MNRDSRRTDRRGFTMIELMIVVTIIGLLSTIAIPELISFSRRAKKSERKQMMVAIARAINDYWIANGSFPGGGGNTMTLTSNPPFPVDGTKQAFSASLPGWSELPFKPDGTLYYRYDATGTVSGSTGTMIITAQADLDRNTIPNVETYTYTLQQDVWQLSTEVESGELY